MNPRILLFALPMALAGACAGKPQAKAAPASAAQPPELKVAAGLDEANFDRSAKPCDDFYQFACGGWVKTHEIPPDRARWGTFDALAEKNENKLHDTLEGLRGGKGIDPDPYGDKLTAYYGSCMAEDKIEAGSAAEVQAAWKRTDGIKNIEALAKELARMHLQGANALFDSGSEQDAKDATLEIGAVDQAGLGLPDRDFYTRPDERSAGIRTKYVAHVAKMLVLGGEKEGQAQKDAAAIMALETRLAKASQTRVERRDPKTVYHRLEMAGLSKLAPHFPWKSYWADLGEPEITQINVISPGFMGELDKMLTSEPINAWKPYLRWHAVHALSPALAQKFVNENFDFYGKTISGQKELPVRWKRCVRSTSMALGFALGRPFVRANFGDDGKSASLEVVHGIETAMENNLKKLTWMDDASRKAANEKLHAIANKIGFPDNWRNYDALKVGNSYAANVAAAREFEAHRELAKIGKPVDRAEWGMAPPTVNAYYNPSLNEMVFPAGILQPPFFSHDALPAVNYGGAGMVVGHELTHGFDDQGRQFDGKGNLREWCSPDVVKEFDKRAQCVVDQFSAYTVPGDIHLNGKLTLGENIADLGGLKLAYTAYKAKHTPMRAAGFTDDQLFFLGAAQIWCGDVRPEEGALRAQTDPHSPGHYRVNGPMSNLPEFAAAFQCKPADKMVSKNMCTIW